MALHHHAASAPRLVVEPSLHAASRASLARLHAEPTFRADLEAARAELAVVRGKGLKPNRDCSAESAALAVKPSLAQ